MTSYSIRGYPKIPSRELIGKVVVGSVSYLEGDRFWLQRDPDKVTSLLFQPGENASSESSCGVGDSVLGWWEEAWYRGLVTGTTEDEVVVYFLDWGNTASLVREQVRQAEKKDKKESPLSIKCRMVDGQSLSEAELEKKEYKVELRCLKLVREVFVMSKQLELVAEEPVFPPGVLVPVFVGYVETVSRVWVTPQVRLEGVAAFQETVELVGSLLDSEAGQLKSLSGVIVGQMAVARFSEDSELYRCRAERREGGDGWWVRFVDFGNGEVKKDWELFEMSEKLLNIEDNSICVDLQTELEDTVLNRDVVKTSLYSDGVKIKVGDEGKVAFFLGEEEIMFKPRGDTVKKEDLLDRRAKVIDVTETDHEDPECLSEEAEQRLLPISVSHVETVSQVWVTEQRYLEVREQLLTKLAEVRDKLCPVTKPAVGDLVGTVYSQDDAVYRARVESVDGQGNVKVLFVDFGNKEMQSVSSLLKLPDEMSMTLYPAMAELVTLADMGDIPDVEQNRDVMEDMLDLENLEMKRLANKEVEMYSEKKIMDFLSKMTFHAEGRAETHENIAKNSPPRTQLPTMWKEGDQVNAFCSQMSRWKRVKILNISEDQAKVCSMDNDENRVAWSGQVKSEKMPLAALNDLEEVLSESGYNSFHVAGTKSEGDSSPAAHRTCSPSLSLVKKVPMFRNTDISQAVVDTWIKMTVKRFEETKELENLPKLKKPLTATVMNQMDKGFVASNGGDLREEGRMVTIGNCGNEGGASGSSVPAQISATSEGLDTMPGILDTEEEISKMVNKGENHMDMMSSLPSCQEVNKLIRSTSPQFQRSFLLDCIARNFPQLALQPGGLLVVQTVLLEGSQDQRELLVRQLEDKEILLSLLATKEGSIVARKCLPHFQPSTVDAVVTVLLDKMGEVGSSLGSSLFVEEFISQYEGLPVVDLLVEEIMFNLRPLVFSVGGHGLATSVLTNNTARLLRAARWLVEHIREVLQDQHAVSVVLTVVQQLLLTDRTRALDRMVDILLNTPGSGVEPLLVTVAKQQTGHLVVKELATQQARLGRCRGRLVDTINTHKGLLQRDFYGLMVVKGMGGWL